MKNSFLLIREFCFKYLKNKNYSVHTIESYYKHLICFYNKWKDYKASSWAELEENHIKTHILFLLNTQKLNPKSINAHLSTINSIIKFLNKYQDFKINLKIKKLKISHKLPNSIDVDMLNNALNKIGNDKHNIRNQAILELLYSSALRVQEITNLNLENIYWDNNNIHIKSGKGNKDRIVPFGNKAKIALKQWLIYRNVYLKNSNNLNSKALFISNRGTRIAKRTIQHIVNLWGINSQLGKVNPHQLRHSCASHLLESGGNIRMIQQMLGHKDLNSTQIYTHIDQQKLQNIYHKSHPKTKKALKK